VVQRKIRKYNFKRLENEWLLPFLTLSSFILVLHTSSRMTEDSAVTPTLAPAGKKASAKKRTREETLEEQLKELREQHRIKLAQVETKFNADLRETRMKHLTAVSTAKKIAQLALDAIMLERTRVGIYSAQAEKLKASLKNLWEKHERVSCAVAHCENHAMVVIHSAANGGNHSVCAECFQGLLDQAIKKDKFTCPLCRYETPASASGQLVLRFQKLNSHLAYWSPALEQDPDNVPSTILTHDVVVSLCHGPGPGTRLIYRNLTSLLPVGQDPDAFYGFAQSLSDEPAKRLPAPAPAPPPPINLIDDHEIPEEDDEDGEPASM
jgi:hypothetical protein